MTKSTAARIRYALINSGDVELVKLADKLDDFEIMKLREILDRYPLQSDMPD